MSSENEETRELLRAVTLILGGVKGLALAQAERLAPTTCSATAPEESDEPEEGTALLGSEIRCIVRDQIEPAIRALKALTGGLEPE